jgi:phage terminase small subunit
MANDKKPISLVKLQGNYRKDRHSTAEFKPDPGIPDAPGCLNGEALAEWNRVTTLLHDQRLISMLDRVALAQYCILWQQLNDDPESFTGALHNQLRNACAALGFSPATRHKIARLDTPDAGQANPWDRFTKEA